MKKIFISVISHNHANMIKNMGVLKRLALYCNVVVRSNVNEDIQEYCSEHGIIYINPSVVMGFGENNNIVFSYCVNYLGMGENDIFIVLNPDVDIEWRTILSVATKMDANDIDLATINLYRDYNMVAYDNSVRKFPNFLTFISSYLGFGNKTILDKSKINEDCLVDWAAGSFLAIRASLYKKIEGFDIKYFMYCEDIDLCYKAQCAGHGLMYFPSLKAVHLAQHANRRLFSIHFIWHVKSAIRFLIKKVVSDVKRKIK
ncbi:glycosyltransferase family 2 protein [Aeromonas sp. A-5]|uniref:glycosyltransferase family 2 protein n=1 Tax=Aeromonas ichthyocola TaxID=3367746 RepID=UPI0038DF97F2